MKEIKGYEGKYSAMEEGFIYSHKMKRPLKGMKNIKNDYYFVLLTDKEGNHNFYYVHRLILETFCPNTENKPEVDHINGDRGDNRLCNLRWATKKENRNNPITIKRMQEASKGRPSKRKIKIQQMDLDGNIIAVYDSETEAAEKNNMRRTDISAVINGVQKTAKGFKWNRL